MANAEWRRQDQISSAWGQLHRAVSDRCCALLTGPVSDNRSRNNLETDRHDIGSMAELEDAWNIRLALLEAIVAGRIDPCNVRQIRLD